MSWTSDQIASLRADIAAAREYADYDEVLSVARARTFRTAVRRLIVEKPQEAQLGGSVGERIRNDINALAKLLPDATRFIGHADANRNQHSYVNLECYRD